MLLRSAGGHAPWHSNVRSKYDFLPAALAAEVRPNPLTPPCASPAKIGPSLD